MAFIVLAAKAEITHLTIARRALVLRRGLLDRDSKARQACVDLLLSWLRGAATKLARSAPLWRCCDVPGELCDSDTDAASLAAQWCSLCIARDGHTALGNGDRSRIVVVVVRVQRATTTRWSCCAAWTSSRTRCARSCLGCRLVKSCKEIRSVEAFRSGVLRFPVQHNIAAPVMFVLLHIRLNSVSALRTAFDVPAFLERAMS